MKIIEDHQRFCAYKSYLLVFTILDIKTEILEIPIHLNVTMKTHCVLIYVTQFLKQNRIYKLTWKEEVLFHIFVNDLNAQLNRRQQDSLICFYIQLVPIWYFSQSLLKKHDHTNMYFNNFFK